MIENKYGEGLIAGIIEISCLTARMIYLAFSTPNYLEKSKLRNGLNFFHPDSHPGNNEISVNIREII